MRLFSPVFSGSPVRAGAGLALILCLSPAGGGTRGESAVSVATLAAGDLVEYARQPAPVRRLIDKALALTRRDLGYRFGSNSPENGGMDCSGTINHTLASVGLRPPRTSYDQYQWARKAGGVNEEPGAFHSFDHPAFKRLRPGDLLFWTGTYQTDGRDPPISHVMIYLGTHRGDGRPVIFGASDGRRFRGKRIAGVSVFDFPLPGTDSPSKFIAFGPVPGLR